MQLTRASEYGLSGLLNLARWRPGAAVMGENVSPQAAPTDPFTNVFRALAGAGSPRSHRGAGGDPTPDQSHAPTTPVEIGEFVEVSRRPRPCFDTVTGCAFQTAASRGEPVGPARRILQEKLERPTLVGLARRHLPRAGRAGAALAPLR